MTETATAAPERITVCDGKYTLVMDPTGLRALRYGEDWRDLIGDGFVMALGHEILELREMLTACGQQFRAYEKSLLAKDTDDSRAKAIVNAEFAARCEAMVSR